MAETEVESILREIRERVLSQQHAGQDVAATRAASGGNGSGESGSSRQPALADSETLTAENLSLINSYLATTGRAWDRLPPLLSNRSGLIARLELWLKRHMKRATRWYSWEQVNFNAAVHHALREMLSVLSAHEEELRRLRAQITELEQYQTALLTELRTVIDAQRSVTETRIDGLENELRERNAQLRDELRDEQRVCFKQLSLETSEAVVLEDRARRKTEALLEELRSRIGQLEKSKSDE
jgi:hypothetical protein